MICAVKRSALASLDRPGSAQPVAQASPTDALKGYVLHPVHRAFGAADRRALEASYAPGSGAFTVPARTAVVFVRP